MNTTTESVINTLKEDGFCELENQDSMLTIRFRRFFRPEKEFLFTLNAKPVDSCKTKTTAAKKIQNFIDKGFKISQQ